MEYVHAGSNKQCLKWIKHSHMNIQRETESFAGGGPLEPSSFEAAPHPSGEVHSGHSCAGHHWPTHKKTGASAGSGRYFKPFTGLLNGVYRH